MESQFSFFITCHCSAVPVSHSKELPPPSFAIRGVYNTESYLTKVLFGISEELQGM